MYTHTIRVLEQGDGEYFRGKPVEFNLSQLPAHCEHEYMNLSRKVVDEHGNIIVGILCEMCAWSAYVDILWVDQNHRKSGPGSKLLAEVETHAKASGCELIHPDTLDFQARGFYLKQGYEVFGTLADCPPGHQRFFLSKRLW